MKHLMYFMVILPVNKWYMLKISNHPIKNKQYKYSTIANEFEETRITHSNTTDLPQNS